MTQIQAILLQGLKNCDTCKKAIKALESKGIAVRFQDVRAEPMDAESLSHAFETFGEKLVNTRSTTWRGLSEAERAEPPLVLLERHPTLMKRPIISAKMADGARVTLGWDKATQELWLA